MFASQVSGNAGSLSNHPNQELAPVEKLCQNILAIDKLLDIEVPGNHPTHPAIAVPIFAQAGVTPLSEKQYCKPDLTRLWEKLKMVLIGCLWINI